MSTDEPVPFAVGVTVVALPSGHEDARVMSGFDIAAATTTFLLLLPAELPDKTFVATLVLASRFPRGPVLVGVVGAFGVQCAIAVAAGGLLGLLPDRLVSAAAAVLFALGAVVMLRGARGDRARLAAEQDALLAEEQDAIARAAHDQPDAGPSRGGQRSALSVAGLSFTVLFVAEWGDLSQLLTAAQSARTGSPGAVFVGAWLALATVATLAVVLGGWLRDRVPLARVRLVSGGVLIVLALVAASDAIRG